MAIHRNRSRAFNLQNQYGLSFDGVDEYVNIDSTLTPLAASTAGTWSCWVKPVEATPAASMDFIAFGDTNANEVMEMIINSSGKAHIQCNIGGSGRWQVTTDAAVFSDNTWTHYVFTQDATTDAPIIYIDGVKPAQANGVSTDNADWFSQATGIDNGRIGNRSFLNAYIPSHFNGEMDEVCIWDSVLTPVEVLELYNKGNPLNPKKLPQQANIIAHYRLGDGNDEFSTNWNMPEASSGIDNKKSILFDGVDEYVNIDSAVSSLASTTVGTWSMWIKPTAAPAGAELFVAFMDTSASQGIELMRTTATPTGRIDFRGRTGGVMDWNMDTDAAHTPAGEWTHVTVVQDAVSPVIYVNGVAVASTFVTSTDKTTWFADYAGIDNGRIGNRSFNGGGEALFYPGNIDEVMIFDTNFSAAQVLALYNNGSPASTPSAATSANLVSHYRMGDGDIAGFSTQSMLLDGVDEYVNIDTLQQTTASDTTGTISMWVKMVDSTPAATENIWAFGDTDAVTEFDIDVTTGGILRFVAREASTVKFVDSVDVAPFTSGKWHHISYVQDGVSPVWYFDGVLRASTISSETDKTVWFASFAGLDNGRIGCKDFNSAGNALFFNGNIDEVNFHNSALTAAEVLAVYNLGIPKDNSSDYGNYASSADLVASYRMGELGEFSTNWHLPEAASGLDNRKSVLFDGVDETVNIDGVVTPLASTTVGTFSAWVKPPDATPAAHTSIIGFGDTDASEYMNFNIKTTGVLRFSYKDGDSGGEDWRVVTDAAPFTDNTWTHVAIVQDAISPVLYVNGVAVAQTFEASGDKTKWFAAGAGFDNGRISGVNQNSAGVIQFFDGNIDEVIFWNSALTAAEMLELYNNGSPTDPLTDVGNYASSADVVAYYKMGDGDTSPTLIDNSTNSNNGTLVNTEAADIEYDTPLLGVSVNMEEADRETNDVASFNMVDVKGSNDGNTVNVEIADIAFDTPLLATSVNMEEADKVTGK